MTYDPKRVFRDRLETEAKALSALAERPPAGKLRDSVLRKAREFVAVANVTKWTEAPELQPPK